MSETLDYSREPTHSSVLVVRGHEPYNAEPALPDLTKNFITPEEFAYCRNHSPILAPPGDAHIITIDGEVGQTLQLSVKELKETFRRKEVVALLQCAGNRRYHMALNTGKPVKGIPWEDGAITNGRWAGIPLRDVLLHVGLKLDAAKESAHVWFACSDKCQDDDYYGGSIPLDKALDEDGDVLLAYEMNGKTLTPDRGFPLRLVVPGIYGMRWVKWVDRISVSRDESPNYYQQRDYKILPLEVDTPLKAKAYWNKVPSMQYLSMNSAVTSINVLPSEDKSPSSRKLVVRGYAVNTFLPGKSVPLDKIDVTLDDGKTWHDAEIIYREKWSWTLWEVTVPVPADRESGEVWSRAHCGTGRKQTREGTSPWNMRGVAYDGVGIGKW